MSSWNSSTKVNKKILQQLKSTNADQRRVLPADIAGIVRHRDDYLSKSDYSQKKKKKPRGSQVFAGLNDTGGEGGGRIRSLGKASVVIKGCGLSRQNVHRNSMEWNHSLQSGVDGSPREIRFSAVLSPTRTDFPRGFPRRFGSPPMEPRKRLVDGDAVNNVTKVCIRGRTKVAWMDRFEGKENSC